MRVKYEKKYNTKFQNKQNPKTAEHALGDCSEASIELALLKGWKMSEITRVRWIHPNSGSAPGRGIDIICFSLPDTNDCKKGIWLFEVKGASTDASLKKQISDIKEYINRKAHALEKEFIELNTWINQITYQDNQLREYFLEILSADENKIHMGGGLVCDANLLDNNKENDFKESIKQFEHDLDIPGLIILSVKGIKEIIKKYKDGIF
ncbi:MAG: hypothetical protein GF311_17460 [Candidatus Lokiarchaeota archaeon]|nr:hypothetical protein [Candidatus Lokiarchaeota archaeon]